MALGAPLTADHPLRGLRCAQDWVGVRQTPWGSRLWWNWQLDDHSYAGWASLREELRSRHPPIRMLTYVNSMFSDLGGTHKVANASRHMFAEAAAKGYLVNAAPLKGPRIHPASPAAVSAAAASAAASASSAASSTSAAAPKPHLVDVAGYFAAMLDLTNPHAREWMRDTVLHREMLGGGGLDGMADGWMADFGEALPCEGVTLHGGQPACAYHNQYAVDWARLNWQAAEEAGRAEDVLIFSRSGFTTSPGTARLFWLGDQLHTWDEQYAAAHRPCCHHRRPSLQLPASPLHRLPIPLLDLPAPPDLPQNSPIPDLSTFPPPALPAAMASRPPSPQRSPADCRATRSPTQTSAATPPSTTTPSSSRRSWGAPRSRPLRTPAHARARPRTARARPCTARAHSP